MNKLNNKIYSKNERKTFTIQLASWPLATHSTKCDIQFNLTKMLYTDTSNNLNKAK